MVGQEVHTTLKVAMREEVYSGWAENPAVSQCTCQKNGAVLRHGQDNHALQHNQLQQHESQQCVALMCLVTSTSTQAVLC